MRRLLVLIGFGVAACSSDGPAKTEDADVCGASSKAAASRVLAVASANATCSKDADCAVLPVNASCFDACTRSVNETGKTAVDRAETLVEAAECKSFKAGGCKLTSPPCAPPAPPACRAGRCE